MTEKKNRMKTWKKLCLFSVSIICLLGVSIVLFYKVTNYTGRKAWERYVQECEEQNRTAVSDTERRYLWLKEIHLSPVDESQNFANYPLFRTVSRLENENDNNIGNEELKPWKEVLEPNGVGYAGKADFHKSRRADYKKFITTERDPEPSSEENASPYNQRKKSLASMAKRSEELKEYLDTHTQEEIAQLMLERLEPGLSAYQDIQNALEKYPQCHYPLQYEKGFMIGTLHLHVLQKIAAFGYTKAYANLALDRSDEAVKDILFVMKLADTLSANPHMIYVAVKRGIYEEVLCVIWEGIESNAWTKNDLKQIQEHLAKTDLYMDILSGTIGERAILNEHFFKDPRFLLNEDPDLSFKEDLLNKIWVNHWSIKDILDSYYVRNWIKNCIPLGWNYRALLEYNKAMDCLLSCFDVENNCLDMNIFPRLNSKLCDAPYYWKINKVPQVATEYFEGLVICGSCQVSMQGDCKIQSCVNMAQISCALERFYLENEKYPDSLDELGELLPKEKLPRDWIDGKAPRMRLTDTGYILWCNGWNFKDDGGTRDTRIVQLLSEPQGDWVWEIAR